MSDLLQRIQQLQFTDRPAAEKLTMEFIRSAFPLDPLSVELRPLAVSLNSFNGFVTLNDGRRLFFKSHTETDTVIGEYYQASMLAEAGYPILQPLYSSTAVGQQVLIYEVIDDPSVFDIAWAIESGDAGDALAPLTAAQYDCDRRLFALYQQSLTHLEADSAARAPIHQLFHHRLMGGRFVRFYGALPGQTGDDRLIDLGSGQESLLAARQAQWIINGQAYTESLDAVVNRALRLLEPAQAGPAISGHGDAHNGNVFFRRRLQPPSLLYFDPAFAGQHHPLLDLVKPMFHNVFAMWMYHPQIKAAATRITRTQRSGYWEVEYDYALPSIRRMFLDSKTQHTLIPILNHLQASGQLRADWRAYFKAALMCCPLLTMNLADAGRFPPSISLLGLCMAVEMGSESQGERSLIDRSLDEVEAAIN